MLFSAFLKVFKGHNLKIKDKTCWIFKSISIKWEYHGHFLKYLFLFLLILIF